MTPSYSFPKNSANWPFFFAFSMNLGPINSNFDLIFGAKSSNETILITFQNTVWILVSIFLPDYYLEKDTFYYYTAENFFSTSFIASQTLEFGEFLFRLRWMQARKRGALRPAIYFLRRRRNGMFICLKTQAKLKLKNGV